MLLLLSACILIFPADPVSQAPNTWQKHNYTSVGYPVVSAYENDFVWAERSNKAYVFAGHILYNTNITWEFDFADNTFTELVTFLRPQKR
jgi:hypothetical protein